MNTSEQGHNVHDHEFWMQRCLDLASNGEGKVAPNPLVGCVIVHEGKVIGEGYHKKFGLAHAEVNAIAAVKDKTLLSTSTLYVNLEPCSHQGKTPPCSNLIIEHNLKKVVIGTVDANEIVNGSGLKKLEDAGIEIMVNVLTGKCLDLNRRFYTFHKEKRPFYTLKWAETNDGFIYSDKHKQGISNELSNQKVHQIRSEEQAILIGKHTLTTDNPRLNVRLIEGNNPLRIVVTGEFDESLRHQDIFKDRIPTLIFNTGISSKEGNIEFIKYNKGNFISELNETLYQRGVNSVLVEGGTTTLMSFISSKNWDIAYRIVSQKSFDQGVTAPTILTSPNTKEKVGHGNNGDQWYSYLNTNN